MIITKVKWTLDQYHRMVDAGVLDDERVELLRGEIVQMPPEGMPHAHKSSQTGRYLIMTLGDRADVRMAKPVTLPSGSEPEPDVAIVQELGDEYLNHHPYPENIYWLIEYSNTSLDKDLGIKAEIYAEAKIPEYWVVNLKTGVLIVFRDPLNGLYHSRQEFTQGVIHPLEFPDIAISVAALFP